MDGGVVKSFYNIEQDGITQGLLYKWLECRQMANWYLQGYSAKGSSMALTYGTIVHAILENIYKDVQSGMKGLPNSMGIQKYSNAIEKQWRRENPNADKKSLEFLETSLLIAEATMPVYFEYWNKDIIEFPWKRLEQEFRIPYTLRDGRKTFLRGKMDGVYGKKDIWLFETKTKSYIQEKDLVDMLPFELQVNTYMWVLKKLHNQTPKGMLYNMIRRVGLEQKKKETLQQYSARCVADMRKRPEHYFIRLEVSMGSQDLILFEREMESMITDFYDWWQGKAGHYKNPGACINKYGRCKYLTACSAGKITSQYEKRKQVFRELEDV